MDENRLDCFARIDETTCNALVKKDCKNCSFYKRKCEVPNYERFLRLGKKELVKKNEKKMEKKTKQMY